MRSSQSWLAFALQKLRRTEGAGHRAEPGPRRRQRRELRERCRYRRTSRVAAVHDPAVKDRSAQASTRITGSAQERLPGPRPKAGGLAEAAGVPDHDDRLVPADRRDPPGAQPVQERRAGRGRLQAADASRRSTAASASRKRWGSTCSCTAKPSATTWCEYFGEQLDGYAFTQFGWVQSYGSRCVKPPILFGDISRPKAMTVEWTKYAQSLTDKPMKGMLTGPVTILNWSFVRDDQPRPTPCHQLALAIREEVLTCEKAGIASSRSTSRRCVKALPLRSADRERVPATGPSSRSACHRRCADETQIHTHMCYSEFNDIIASIADMDADVITIETSRSDMELLDDFDSFNYPNEIGPGVYDIHSPSIPSAGEMVAIAAQTRCRRLPAERLWVNPDCGLKTRQCDEVTRAAEHGRCRQDVARGRLGRRLSR